MCADPMECNERFFNLFETWHLEGAMQSKLGLRFASDLLCSFQGAVTEENEDFIRAFVRICEAEELVAAVIYAETAGLVETEHVPSFIELASSYLRSKGKK